MKTEMRRYLTCLFFLLLSFETRAKNPDFAPSLFSADGKNPIVYGKTPHQKWQVFPDGKFLFARQLSGRSTEKTKIGTYTSAGGVLGTGYSLKPIPFEKVSLPTIQGLVWVDTPAGIPRTSLSKGFGEAFSKQELALGMDTVMNSMKTLAPPNSPEPENSKKSKTLEKTPEKGAPEQIEHQTSSAN